jgi:hypothetical protein
MPKTNDFKYWPRAGFVEDFRRVVYKQGSSTIKPQAVCHIRMRNRRASRDRTQTGQLWREEQVYAHAGELNIEKRLL